ncbi:MAG: LytTR family DNA-binding domain-containing protein [Phenylobacterium sp.]|nr:LytTR family DNA-binding domain-containing protein [Phenylobacterium sp.]
MSLRTVLVDDEPVALRRLSQVLRGVPAVELVGTASDGIHARQIIDATRPDLVILDIEMPGCSGLDVAALLAAGPGPEIVFLTAFGRYAQMAFEVEAADYLLKPVSPERLTQAIQRVRRRLDARNATAALRPEAATPAPTPAEDGRPNAIWVPVKGGEARVLADEIIWIEGAGDYVVVHTALRSHLVRATMNSVEKTFSPSRLRRVHRSAMVNLATVQQIRRPGRGALGLLLKDEVEVAVGPSYAAGVMGALKPGGL